MKNLEIYLDDDTKVFECVISNHTGIVKVHSNTTMPSLKDMIQSVIDGKYKIEFEDRMIDTSCADTIFDRVDMFQIGENFKIIFNSITPLKVLDYVYGTSIPQKKDIKKIVKFFKIELNNKEMSSGIGEALLRDSKFVINYKRQYYKQREKFTIAHELGHILLHFSTNKKDFFIDFDDDLNPVNKTDYRKILRASRNNIQNYHPTLEKEADKFARDLLVPSFQLNDYINSFISIYGEKPYMSFLKDEFAVSKGTIFYALKDANLISRVIDDCKYW